MGRVRPRVTASSLVLAARRRDGRRWSPVVVPRRDEEPTRHRCGTRRGTRWPRGERGIELSELRIVDLTPATDASADLFGYSIVSDAVWTYMYGHCHRQFVPQAHHGFDPECSPHTFVARVPKGQFDAALEYWSATVGPLTRTAKVPVITGTESGPVSVQKFGTSTSTHRTKATGGAATSSSRRHGDPKGRGRWPRRSPCRRSAGNSATPMARS